MNGILNRLVLSIGFVVCIPQFVWSAEGGSTPGPSPNDKSRAEIRELLQKRLDAINSDLKEIGERKKEAQSSVTRAHKSYRLRQFRSKAIWGALTLTLAAVAGWFMYRPDYGDIFINSEGSIFSSAITAITVGLITYPFFSARKNAEPPKMEEKKYDDWARLTLPKKGDKEPLLQEFSKNTDLISAEVRRLQDYLASAQVAATQTLKPQSRIGKFIESKPWLKKISRKNRKFDRRRELLGAAYESFYTSLQNLGVTERDLNTSLREAMWSPAEQDETAMLAHCKQTIEGLPMASITRTFPLAAASKPH